MIGQHTNFTGTVMQLKQLNFIHFFLLEKEYLLEVLTIKEVAIVADTVKIIFKSVGEVPPVLEFFVKYAEEEFLFFFGNSDTKYDKPVVSRLCHFTGSSLLDGHGSLQLEFKIKERRAEHGNN